MKCKDGSIKIIEYNCRFGDPECVIALSLLKSNFYEICLNILRCEGIRNMELDFDKRAMLGVYMVPQSYPYTKSEKYDIYFGLLKLGSESVSIFPPCALIISLNILSALPLFILALIFD